uniref:NADH-ubiquinone oxidoreductase chain 3 n=1 Tax=Sivaloka damnosus TaxID=568780 RepID=D8KZG8_SIVDA|nr:NADH dehydrogenase subunit 3 [Sivaloka damnosus]
MKITMMTLNLVIILNLVFYMTMMISKKEKSSREKTSPFECGFSPMSSARKPFSIHFFLIGILFLIFDIEISIILPMASTKMTNMTEWMISSSIIILILIMGLIQEWKNGMLEWTN